MITLPYSNKGASGFLVGSAVFKAVEAAHARAKAAAKRKRDGGRVDLDLAQVTTPPSGDHAIDIIELDEALSRLAEADQKMASVVDLWFFGGLTTEEIAEIQGVSSRTIKRQWRQARAWLNSELSPT